MHHDRDRPDDWVERAAEQAIALHKTVRDHPELREIVDLLLFELANRIAQRIADGAP